jgi:serpin B
MRIQLLLCLALVLSGNVLGGFRAIAAPSIQARQVVDGDNGFAADLYGKLRGQNGNLFFSPYSISTALAMTYSGARGRTATQMAQTLHFDLPADNLPPAFAEMATGLDAIQQKGNVKLAVANSLWPQKKFSFRPEYLDLCQKYYGAAIYPVDFVGHAEDARKTINDWVAGKTNGKIVDLLAPHTVDGARLVLVNAIYFKGDWANRFNAALTQDEPFHVSAQTTTTVPLMQQTSEFGYAEFPDLQVLEMPYAGNDLSMVVLLPRAADGLGKLEAQLTAAQLAAWTTNLPSRKVQMFFPKFTATSQFSLGDTLAGMGMADAFDPGKANFSGMDGREDLYISSVIHKAYVKVDEEGTEAAAATAVTMKFAGVMRELLPPVFRADHPFLFLIRDNHTGSILFLGRMTHPTQ